MKHGPTIALIVSFSVALSFALMPSDGEARELRRAVREQRRNPIIVAQMWDEAIQATPWTEHIRMRREFLDEELQVRRMLPTPYLRELYDTVWDAGEQFYRTLDSAYTEASETEDAD